MTTEPKEPKGPTRVQEALKMQQVPSEKWQSMVQRTVLGLGFLGLGVVGLVRLDWNVYVGLAVCVVGATLWSTQLVVGSLTQLVPLFRSIWDAVRGKTGGPPS